MTLFVGGVHAVGKTFILKSACETLGLQHATASQLIREQRGLPNWTISRQVENIDENQQALIAAVKRLGNDANKLILDGHFVLRRSIGIHEKIDANIFNQLMIKGVILLEAPISIISERLLQRGDITWEQSEIEIFSKKERECAEYICSHLKIPLIPLFSPSTLEVQDAIRKLKI